MTLMGTVAAARGITMLPRNWARVPPVISVLSWWGVVTSSGISLGWALTISDLSVSARTATVPPLPTSPMVPTTGTSASSMIFR